MKLLLSAPYFAVLSLVIGATLALLMPVAWDSARDQYNREHPVWVADKVTLLERQADVVRLSIEGEKTRDCMLLRVWAQSLYEARPPTDSGVSRVGPLPLGYRNRPVGKQDLGEFLVYNVPADANAVVIHVEHSCAGAVVLSQLGQTPLPATNR